MAMEGVRQRSTLKVENRVDWVATATQVADCLTKSMKPTYMLRVLDTCRYQISREGYSKPSAGGKKSETVPEGQ